MSKQDNLTDFLTDVADAIREKKGTTEKINPQNFSEEIRGIESGGNIGYMADVIDPTATGITNISKVVVNDGIKTIKIRAFYQWNNLTEVYLPDSVEVLEDNAFQQSTKIRTIRLSPNLTKIGIAAFYSCDSLEGVFPVPIGVTTIEANTFANTRKLSWYDFRMHSSVPTLANISAFSNTRADIVVPDALYDEWISATNWSTYADRIVKASEFVEPTNE
jgi:hypothetical protein